MARLSASAKAKLEKQKAEIQAQLEHYQKLVHSLRTSNESSVVKTQKQREYHKKIQDLKSKMTRLKAD